MSNKEKNGWGGKRKNQTGRPRQYSEDDRYINIKVRTSTTLLIKNIKGKMTYDQVLLDYISLKSNLKIS